MLDEAYAHSHGLLKEKQVILERVAESLVERETLNGEELDLLIEDKPLPPVEQPKPPAPEPQPTNKETSEHPPVAPKIAALGGPQAQPST